MSDLVFIKYNRSLLRRYDMRDTIDPISLEEIDESNEWLVGEMDEDEDNLVRGLEGLTWGVAAEAAGVNEDVYAFRSRPPKTPQVYTRKASFSKASTSKTKTKKSTPSSRGACHLIDEDDNVGYEEDNDDIIGEESESEDGDGEEDDENPTEFADLDD